ncbi:MAG: Glycosyl transferase group 1 [Berkelbacteria bacterium GW2011_GWA2_35_9]|uniref:Glycosyl transferase group 1 n=1 Tax=Berkelbacteria bacterium GW2011_GWA2_35_9 TaxID=1618333 RepID=A0A0G0D461_9BACT|nr:MAG: Glycosyl transferase group 1 [Berkelbacteria bacterium GW2011_GWA2_35_9]
MKIVVFCPYYPPHVGGLETHADEFNQYLSQKGVDIVVFTPLFPTDMPKIEIKHKNVKIVRYPAFEIISGYPLPKFWKLDFWKTFSNITKEKPDFIISRTRFFNTSLLCLIYAKLYKVTWIHIEHGSDFVKLSSSIKTYISKFYDQIIGRLIFNNSNLNISISRAVQRFVYQFDKRFSPIIYRGVDMKQMDKVLPDNKLRTKYQNKIIIAWAGRLYFWKGVEESIKSIHNLPDEIKNHIVFLIIGYGEDYNRLKKMAKYPIILLGQKNREETLAILKIADIYIHSSYPGGGLSTSLIEAMYCKCAIIATPNEGADEIVNKKNGIIIYKHQDIAPSLINLIESGKMKEYAQEANFSIINKLNWKKSSDKYYKILIKLQKIYETREN